MTIRTARTRLAALLLAASSLSVAGGGAAAAQPSSPGGWVESGSAHVNSLTGGQGLASRDDGSLLYRGLGSVPLSLRTQGWNHIGDPDIARGYVFDAYQGGDTATAKMFAVTTPGGQRYEYTHPLDPGEMLNNSFATVSPDARWLVSGEWGDESRLEVFPAPLLNPATPRTGGTLRQAGPIALDHTVSDVQGCDFVSPTRLVCSSDDAAKDLLQVDLEHPLDGTAVTGHVSTLLQLPRRSICSGAFEAEGLDYDAKAGVLRVEVVPPSVCKVTTTVYSYRPTTG
ncbi:hypothetical protein [Streptantibioticus cattleyicolor]|uniref:Secreted protein n=1 Tax=Streptantibioticus cattleyicolor (strain ATCC 35852 / DSM 46488 / JCM 4925 / NBRC 14057 / NRRL 8057) TaxID=1003195 RepID=G8WXX3_STREN|nr:hypothetical protein [Streptomyces sp. SID5468]AEW97273.1 secreted protein [Streptantibioticus cattleyicolor NRRL 8057 = DSM 46488]